MFSIEERWKQHCRERIRKRCEKRPLYNAMNKYGVENFIIEQIEECSEEILSDREIYWINYFDSFKNGYNATRGGDSRHFIDYNLVINTYLKVCNQHKTAKMLGISSDTVHKILKMKGIRIYSSQEIQTKRIGKIVYMYSIQNEYIMVFASLAEAARFILGNDISWRKTGGVRRAIADVCKGCRKSAYGYKWSYDGPKDKIN